ncbi:MAG: hypothetical protein LBR34_02970, partial [Prevotella sp.]|nr:hypothetical protein [Prevotella sp.]
MKKNKFISIAWLLGIFSIIFTACSEDIAKSDYDYKANGALVTSALSFDALEQVSDEEVSLTATITDFGQSEIYDKGFIYSTDENLENYEVISADTTAANPNTLLVEKYVVPQGKTYYFKAFILTKDGIAVSAETKSINLPITWETVGSVDFTDNTFTGDTYPVEIQKFAGRNEYRLVAPFGTEGEYLRFFLDDEWNALEADFPPGAQNCGAEGYTFYWHPDYVGTYCTFTNKANVYTITFLLLRGTSLYTGGEVIFEWVEGYEGEIPEVINYNSMAVEEIPGAVSELHSTAFFNGIWAQTLTKAVDLHPDTPESLYKNLYYLPDLYADGYGLAFYYDGTTVDIPASQKTGAQYRSQDVYVSQSETIESTVAIVNGITVYTLGLAFHLADGTSLGDFAETLYYSENPIEYAIEDFYGNYKLTGTTAFEGYPDALMDVTIAAGATTNTLVITGIDFAESVEAEFDAATSS